MDTAKTEELVSANPYSAIARGYDLIMEHVDYDQWAGFTDELLWSYHPRPNSVRELGCGTGSFAFHLQPLGEYQYTATDKCPEMIEVAREKAALNGKNISFEIEDFSNYTVDEPHDVVILLYDGLNYLLKDEEVVSLFRCTYDALKPGGIFFFDQSTPANSINNEAFFCDEGEMDGFSYVRGSRYDRDSRLHTTTFDIVIDGKSYSEHHTQRAYSYEEIQNLLKATPLETVVAFDGFTSKPANERSERIHWVVRKPQ